MDNKISLHHISQIASVSHFYIEDIKFVPLLFIPVSTHTCLCLVLALRPAPVLRTGALVLIDALHTGAPVLARVTGTFAHICGGGMTHTSSKAVHT